MGKSKWPDFLFTLAVRLVCGVILGCLLYIIFGYRGMLRAFAHNHIKAVEIWLCVFGFGGGLVAVFTTPKWQTPWYRSIRSPDAWRSLDCGITRQELIERLGPPEMQTATGEDIWRNRNWELRVSYDESGRATGISRNATMH